MAQSPVLSERERDVLFIFLQEPLFHYSKSEGWHSHVGLTRLVRLLNTAEGESLRVRSDSPIRHALESLRRKGFLRHTPIDHEYSLELDFLRKNFKAMQRARRQRIEWENKVYASIEDKLMWDETFGIVDKKDVRDDE